jgi:hypothetical protein
MVKQGAFPLGEHLRGGAAAMLANIKLARNKYCSLIWLLYQRRRKKVL